MLHLRTPPPGVIDRPVTPADYAAMGRLHDRVFGPGALTRMAYRIREGGAHHSPFCRVAHHEATLIAFVRFTPVVIGGSGSALMLGPLAVNPSFENLGHARRLLGNGAGAAKTAGIALVVLVGDLAYYGRLGFVPAPHITMPGPVDPERLLALELAEGALGRFAGVIAPLRR